RHRRVRTGAGRSRCLIMVVGSPEWAARRIAGRPVSWWLLVAAEDLDGVFGSESGAVGELAGDQCDGGGAVDSCALGVGSADEVEATVVVDVLTAGGAGD